MREERNKLIPGDKLTINDTTRTITSWLTYDPVTLDSYIQRTPGTMLSKHMELELKRKLLNDSKRQNTRRSSNHGNQTP